MACITHSRVCIDLRNGYKVWFVQEGQDVVSYPVNGKHSQRSVRKCPLMLLMNMHHGFQGPKFAYNPLSIFQA